MRRIICGLLAGAIAFIVLPQPPAAACDTILGCDDDLTWMEDLEAKIADNIWDGQVYELEYNTPDRNPGDIAQVTHFGDSALWTGTYLGSQSFRYATARHYLASDPGNAFWQAQKTQAKERIDQIIEKYDVLINISGDWQHQFQPSLEQTGFGGGIIPGEPGYLMRACIDTDAPEWQRWPDQRLGADPNGLPRPYTTDRRIFGPLEYEGNEYWCEDGTSRDAYAGVIFGLLTAFDLVSVDDPAMRSEIRNNVVTLSNFAFKYLWNTPRPHGRISIPAGTNQNETPCKEINEILHVCGHDFENFISPLFIITPLAQMEMTQAAYHVTQAHPGHPDTAKWDLLETVEGVAMGAAMLIPTDTSMPFNDYYKWNLDHLIIYNLIPHAPNDLFRALFRQAAADMDRQTRDDINAHFEAITYALTGDQDRLDDAVLHLRQWRDYRTRIEAGGLTDNLSRCGTEIACVPEDTVFLHLGDQEIELPTAGDSDVGGSSTLRAKDPLDVEDRAPTDFLWQRQPGQLNGSVSNVHQAPGIDYLLPYWMIRYHTEVKPPASNPLPAPISPEFS